MEGSDGAGPEAKAPPTVITGWGALPPELIRRVGQLQTDPRTLARMERTCRSWRRVVVERNNDAVVDDKPNLWRDLTLAEFPRLHSILTLLVNRIALVSWKDLHRTQFQARVRPDECHLLDPENYEYQPKTNWKDYITTVEFFRDGKFLFATSGIGFGCETPQLWSQKIESRDIDSDDLPVCVRPLDTELTKRMGDDPFGVTNLERIDASVIVTRLSDMKAVRLSRRMTLNVDRTYVSFGGDREVSTIWDGRKYGTGGLPLVRKIHYSYEVNGSELELAFAFTPATGTIAVFFERIWRDEDGDFLDVGDVTFTDEMMYLETQCPWPNSPVDVSDFDDDSSGGPTRTLVSTDTPSQVMAARVAKVARAIMRDSSLDDVDRATAERIMDDLIFDMGCKGQDKSYAYKFVAVFHDEPDANSIYADIADFYKKNARI